MIKILFIIFYFLYGYICCKNGIDAYGGKDEYLKANNMSSTDYYILWTMVMVFWPVLTIRAIIKKVKEHDE